MATITKRRSGKWTAQIRSHNKYISKTFLKKAHASMWAKEIELLRFIFNHIQLYHYSIKG